MKVKTKVNSKKPFIPPQPIQSIPPEQVMGQPNMKQMPLKELLFELNQNLDGIKTTYNNIILQQNAKLQELMKDAKNVKDL